MKSLIFNTATKKTGNNFAVNEHQESVPERRSFLARHSPVCDEKVARGHRTSYSKIAILTAGSAALLYILGRGFAGIAKSPTRVRPLPNGNSPTARYPEGLCPGEYHVKFANYDGPHHGAAGPEELNHIWNFTRSNDNILSLQFDSGTRSSNVSEEPNGSFWVELPMESIISIGDCLLKLDRKPSFEGQVTNNSFFLDYSFMRNPINAHPHDGSRPCGDQDTDWRNDYLYRGRLTGTKLSDS